MSDASETINDAGNMAPTTRRLLKTLLLKLARLRNEKSVGRQSWLDYINWQHVERETAAKIKTRLLLMLQDSDAVMFGPRYNFANLYRDGPIIFRDLVGKLTVLRIECDAASQNHRKPVETAGL